MAEYGPCVLKDCELLAIIFGSGTKGENVLEVSGRLLRKHKIDTLSGMGIKDLEKMQGIGRVKASSWLRVLRSREGPRPSRTNPRYEARRTF